MLEIKRNGKPLGIGAFEILESHISVNYVR
jgi:hypothetical protein